MQLKTKLTLLITLLALIPLFVVSGLSYVNQRDALHKQSIEHFISVADIQEKRVIEQLERYLEHVNLVTARTQLRISLRTFNETQDASERSRIIKIISDAQYSSSLVNVISVIDLNGDIIASTKPVLVGHNVSGEAFFELGKQTDVLYDVTKDDQGESIALLTGPLVLDGELIGLVQIVATTAPLLGVTKDYSGLGQTGETLLAKMTSAGDAIFLTPLRFEPDATLEKVIARQRTDVPIIPAISGQELILSNEHTVDYRGEPVLAVTRFIEPLGWGLVAKIDQAEIFAPVRQMALVTISVVVLSGLLLVLIAYFVTLKITLPIKSLTLFAQNLQSGNFKMRTEVKESNEIGILAGTFNTMAAELQSFYERLEKKVNERTEELNQQLARTEGQNKELESVKKAMLNVLEDVEAEKQRAESLADDLEKFKQAVDNTSDMIIITDVEGMVLYGNRAVEKITGYEVEEVIGKKAAVLWKTPMPQEFYKTMWHTIKVGKKPFNAQLRNRKKDGSEYDADVSIAPVIDAEGQVIFFVGIERDITKETEVDRAKTEFVSLASHQLRTPLSTINWYTEMLLDGDAGALSDEQREYLNEIYTGNQRMVSLVGALLNVSRLDLGTFSVDPEVLRLETVADSVVKELQNQIDERKIKFTKKYSKQLPEVMTDYNLTRIIFQNLLSNAIKYTSISGRVSLEIQVEDDNAIITVTDSGMGIPKNQQNKVFTKLFRADNVKAADTEGTGLGLYIVKAIADYMGGKVWFESEENKGATFYVRFPFAGMSKKQGSRKLQ